MKNILKIFYNLLFEYIYNIVVNLLYVIRNLSTKNEAILTENKVYWNLDACDYMLDDIKSNVLYNKTLEYKTLQYNSYTGLLDEKEYGFTTDGETVSRDTLKKDEIDFNSKIKNGTYTYTLGDGILKEGKKYLVTIKLIQAPNSTKFSQVSRSESSERFSDFQKGVFPYSENKQTSVVGISIKGDDEEEGEEGFHLVSKILSEYVELSSNLAAYAIVNHTNKYRGVINLDRDNMRNLAFISYTGGKGYSEGSTCFIVRNGKNKDMTFKFKISNLENFCSEKNKDNIYSNISVIEISVEEFFQKDLQGKNPAGGDTSKVLPEIEYGDEGERFYEPWKHWFDGELLKFDVESGSLVDTWFKKWKTVFKNRVKKHNELLDAANGMEGDVDAWIEDEHYKKDHL